MIFLGIDPGTAITGYALVTERGRSARLGGGDGEAGPTDERQFGDVERIDAGQRRRRETQRMDELVDAGAFDLDQHPLGVVAHEPAEAEPRREAIGVWTKADALHRAAHTQA